MCRKNGTLIVGTVIWIFATAAFIASMLTKYWKQKNNVVGGLGDRYYNLFEHCFVSSIYPCFTHDVEYPHAFIPRIILLVGAGFIALGTVVGFFGMCLKSGCPLITEGALVVVGGIVILAGCATFTGLSWNDGYYFYYSFYLGWVSGALFLLAGILIIIAGSQRAHRLA